MKNELEPGKTLMRPARGKLGQVRLAYPGATEGTQFLLCSIIDRGMYARKAYMVVSQPGEEPKALWATQLTKLSSKVKPADHWK